MAERPERQRSVVVYLGRGGVQLLREATARDRAVEEAQGSPLRLELERLGRDRLAEPAEHPLHLVSLLGPGEPQPIARLDHPLGLNEHGGSAR